MNSNFEYVACKDIVRLIFQNLEVHNLARAACVCRMWRTVASEQEVVVDSFKMPWKLKEVVGSPSSGSFWRDGSLGRFAISHRLVRGDTVASLAVKYAVQVMDIKRLNNMMSDHGIHSRDRLLVPVSNPDLLLNQTCYIEVDTYAKREVAVVYEGGGPGKENARCLVEGEVSEHGKKRVIESLKRSMQVDDGTAHFYLSLTNGDPRAALSEFSHDLTWERNTGYGGL